MSYQALYRKYRPNKLSEIVGQDIIIQILKNSLKNNRVGHAYMFSGPRGTGKTSIAKILAKTISCLDLTNGDACGNCKNCKSIQDTYCVDIIEIDAASNNGVDEIRELKNKITLVPSELKCKVYIIDEVHMLSIGAFNALLKTLEEPPEHVLFILATTDLHKVPNTIISRCQCFEFGRIPKKDLIERIKYICDQEKIKVEVDVLDGIAELSEGCLRDAISMLDKISSYSNSNIKKADFEKVNGIVFFTDKEKFITYLYDNNVLDAIKFIDEIYDTGKDFVIFIQDLITICKDLCIKYYVEDSRSYDISFLLLLSTKLSEILSDIKVASNTKTIFEVNILSIMSQFHVLSNKGNKVLNVKTTDDVSQNVNDNDYQLEKNVASVSDSSNSIEKVDNSDLCNDYNDQIINNCFARADIKNKRSLEKKWVELNAYSLDNEYGAAACYMSDGVIRVVGENEIIITFEYESMVNRGFLLLDNIKLLFKKVFGINYDIALITTSAWEEYREQYISNKNDGINYKYVPLVEVTKNIVDNDLKSSVIMDNSITDQAKQMFGEDLIVNS